MAAIASVSAGCSDVEDIVDLNPYRMIVSEVKVSDITTNSAVVTIYVQNPDAVRRILESNDEINIKCKALRGYYNPIRSCEVYYVDAVAILRAEFKYSSGGGPLDPKTKYEVRFDIDLTFRDTALGGELNVDDLNPEILTSFTTL